MNAFKRYINCIIFPSHHMPIVILNIHSKYRYLSVHFDNDLLSFNSIRHVGKFDFKLNRMNLHVEIVLSFIV